MQLPVAGLAIGNWRLALGSQQSELDFNFSSLFNGLNAEC